MNRKTILNFRWCDKDKWRTRDQSPPGPGDYLASDGCETWIMHRESNAPIGAFCRVKYWREMK